MLNIVFSYTKSQENEAVCLAVTSSTLSKFYINGTSDAKANHMR